MTFLVKDQHIDPDLFRLFLEAGIHTEYATKFLSPEQVDYVDTAKVIRDLYGEEPRFKTA